MKTEIFEEIKTAGDIVDYTDKAVNALRDLKVYLQIRRIECPEVINSFNAMTDFERKKRAEYYNTLSKLDNED